jgi:hypothetical protein
MLLAGVLQQAQALTKTTTVLPEELRMKRAIVLVSLLMLAGLAISGFAEGPKPPSQEAIEFAQRTSNLLTATLFAALLQEFDETTPANVEEGKKSIALVFNDRNTNMRLVGALQPLSDNDLPKDSFEETALAMALQGLPYTAVEKTTGEWAYRRSIPLSNFRVECSMCHTNFPSVPSSSFFVGALMLKVPID